MSYVTPNEKPDPRTDAPTPLTEAHLFGARGGDCVTEVKAVVRANFARRLERENTALRAHAERLAEALEELTDDKASLPGEPRWKAYDKARQALTLYRAENPRV